MLQNMASRDSQVQVSSFSRKKKGGISVQELGYGVIFNGGERTLEKDSRNLDVSKFDCMSEIDPVFMAHRERMDESGAKNLLTNLL